MRSNETHYQIPSSPIANDDPGLLAAIAYLTKRYRRADPRARSTIIEPAYVPPDVLAACLVAEIDQARRQPARLQVGDWVTVPESAELPGFTGRITEIWRNRAVVCGEDYPISELRPLAPEFPYEAISDSDIACYRRALAYYAAPDHWTHGDVPGHIYAHDDAGAQARKALGFVDGVNEMTPSAIQRACEQIMCE